jgi:hypothetical protein
MSKAWASWLWMDYAGGVPGGHRVGSGVGCLNQSGGHALLPLRIQHSWLFSVVKLWQGRRLCVWFSRSMAGCLIISVFTFLSPGNSTLHFFDSQTLAWSVWIWCCVSCIAAWENPPLAILAVFEARCMWDCSWCTWPPCVTTVQDMLKTYKKLDSTASYEIQLLRWPCTLYSMLKRE